MKSAKWRKVITYNPSTLTQLWWIYLFPICFHMSVWVYVLSCSSHIQLFLTLWTVAHQALLSMRFSRQEYWNGLPFPSPGDLPNPEIKPVSTALAGRFFIIEPSVQFSRSVVSDSLRLHEPQHARPPCPSPTPRVHLNPCPLSQWCHPTISSSVVPFSSCPQSFPASGSFPMSQLF